MQYRAAENKDLLVLPKALVEIRYGRMRAAGPNAPSAHVYEIRQTILIKSCLLVSSRTSFTYHCYSR